MATVGPRKIVAGVDFSATTEIATSGALALARGAGVEVVLVHVGEVLAPFDPDRQAGGGFEELFQHRAEAIAKENLGRLEELARGLGRPGVKVTPMQVEGDPVSALCRVASELEADVVVVGSHGLTGRERFLLGSVAEDVVSRCPASVLVARERIPREGYRRILVPISFDTQTDEVIETATSIATAGAEIELLHCWRLPRFLASIRGAELVDLRAAMAERTERQLRERVLAHRVPNVRLCYEQMEAHPRPGIVERLEAEPFDLVVIGSDLPRRGAPVVGAVAAAVTRQASCGVLIVKSAPEKHAGDDSP